MPEVRLAEIEVRVAAATPGPWTASSSGAWVTSKALRESCGGDLFRVVDGSSADADLVVHAPADLAALAAEVRRLRASATSAGDPW
jgi:hypothetical protein